MDHTHTRSVEDWLAEHVNHTSFQNKLEHDIELLDKPNDRVRARLELMSYLMPKVKGVDPLTPDQKVQDIRITYVESKSPKKAKASAPPD
jgi:hypothetical protein